MRDFGKLIAVIMLLVLVAGASAAVPRAINLQGRLIETGSPLADGPQLMKFNIYASGGGDDSLWSSGYQTVQVTRGIFDYLLGGTVPFPADLFEADSNRYLGITVGVAAEMSPRTRITSGAFAMQANVSDLARGVAAGTVDEVALVDSAVASAKIRSGAVEAVHLDKDAVTSNTIVDGTITNADISAAAEISHGKIHGTAVTEDHVQDIFGGKSFYGNVRFRNNLEFNIHDSTMRVTSLGVRIGDAENPSLYSLLNVERHTSRAASFTLTGIRSHISNENTATVYGVRGHTEHTSSSASVGNRYGVYGSSYSPYNYGNSYGVYAQATGGIRSYGLFATASGAQVGNFCAYIDGYTFIDENLYIDGSLSKQSGSFKIDHPQDPENRYLYHSFVESPDMMNVYNGNVELDGNGEAVVPMPGYFEALNKDFRYQLTAIGAPGPNLYIAAEIADNRFTIAGGEPFGKVSWQVTGVRQDPWAEEHRIVVEVDKPARERGLYLHPELYGEGEEKDVNYEDRKAGREAAAGMR